MDTEYSCKNCRHGEMMIGLQRCEGCHATPYLEKPSRWEPLTEAQKVERFVNEWGPKNKLSGSLSEGYEYKPQRKEYHKMYKNKTPKQKALGAIKKVIFNPPYTIVIWEDKTKTTVKCGENEQYDPEKGLAMAMAKRLFSNKGYYYDVFKKWLPKEKLLLAEPKQVLSIDLAPEAILYTYSVKELAEKLGVSEDTVRRDIKNGAYPTAKKEKGKWVIPNTCIL